ncbi:hypothetical protein Cgig2_018621 [Carnegiea gigantea]|uniref:ribonuclease P n=1 Tax=Carnegiea gigantea TaxID=171969 RepID=A0A9Q1QJD5_9CARY|nr:hypothetical protein Cgig2_018621 [Carnegiea gigantea]
MASSSSSLNTLQRREVFFSLSLSNCKCFSPPANSLPSSSLPLAFPSSRHTLPPKLSLFFVVKPPVTVIRPVHNNRSFAFAWLDDNNSSVGTNNYRRTSKNLSSGYSSCGFDEERVVRNFVRGEGDDLVVEEQIEKGFVNDGKTSRRSHFGKRNEKGSRISSSRWINKRGGSEMKENMEKVPVNNNGYARRGLDYEIASRKDSGLSSKRLKVANSDSIVDENVHRQSIKDNNSKNEVQMNEAALTSVARMAMAMGNGDMAFDMVKQMKEMQISPKLRSYGPALSVFSSNGDIEKAFDVEKHMLENGVRPEEPELEALLRLSIQAGKADKVYYLLHKLRTTVRSVSPSTADLIEKWFKGKDAFRVGKRKWDPEMLAQTMENVGGGWHGQGWLGKGKWIVSRTSVGADGMCKCCGEKLALIDLDPQETERFAESVASLAIKRERNSSFQKFQVNLVANGLRHMLPSRKWPLIILHNKRLTGNEMNLAANKAFVERWKKVDALYATPTGSNDDWYWLYAAIKFKCLLVTNDEMRDHIFQLLGTDFFPKWKERHQVRFSFSEGRPVFHMPPPCSVVIQESERGHWHIPIASENQSEGDRIWLCVTRPKSLDHTASANSAKDPKDDVKDDKKCGPSSSHPQLQVRAQSAGRSKPKTEELDVKGHRYLRAVLPKSDAPISNHIPTWNSIQLRC